MLYQVRTPDHFHVRRVEVSETSLVGSIDNTFSITAKSALENLHIGLPKPIFFPVKISNARVAHLGGDVSALLLECSLEGGLVVHLKREQRASLPARLRVDAVHRRHARSCALVHERLDVLLDNLLTFFFQPTEAGNLLRAADPEGLRMITKHLEERLEPVKVPFNPVVFIKPRLLHWRREPDRTMRDGLVGVLTDRSVAFGVLNLVWAAAAGSTGPIHAAKTSCPRELGGVTEYKVVLVLFDGACEKTRGVRGEAHEERHKRVGVARSGRGGRACRHCRADGCIQVRNGGRR